MFYISDQLHFRIFGEINELEEKTVQEPKMLKPTCFQVRTILPTSKLHSEARTVWRSKSQLKLMDLTLL